MTRWRVARAHQAASIALLAAVCRATISVFEAPAAAHLEAMAGRPHTMESTTHGSSAASQQSIDHLQNQLAALQQNSEIYRDTIIRLEKERDFYFQKLRQIEMLAQAAPPGSVTEEVFKKFLEQTCAILYSTEVGLALWLLLPRRAHALTAVFTRAWMIPKLKSRQRRNR